MSIKNFVLLHRSPRGRSSTVWSMREGTRRNWRVLSTSVKTPYLRYNALLQQSKEFQINDDKSIDFVYFLD